MNFNKKTAIVTGGTRGIGEAIVELLLEKGCNVIVTGTKTGHGKFKEKDRLHYLPLNFLEHESVSGFIEVISNLKQIDILVNDAGINIVEPIDKISEQNWNNIMRVNLTGPMQLIQAVIPKMKAGRYGRILNVSSIWAVISKEKRAAYSASKTGLIGLTRAVSLELSAYNIMVNALCPGFTMTDLTRSTLSNSEIVRLSKQVPLGRFAQPKEIAHVAVFLCSGINSYLTGQAITVDGGFSIK